jgi:AraC family transcriptional regulator
MTHADDFQNGARCFLFEIAPGRLAALREVLPMTDPVFLNGGAPAWLMMRLFDEARESDESSSLAAEGLTLEILAALARERSPAARVRHPRWLTHARELLHARLPETLTHDLLAKAVGVHPVHLPSQFRKHFKCTIGDYVRRLRIEHASRQLATSDAPLAEIAATSGFADQSHFSKVFKRHAGMTPANFAQIFASAASTSVSR